MEQQPQIAPARTTPDFSALVPGGAVTKKPQNLTRLIPVVVAVGVVLAVGVAAAGSIIGPAAVAVVGVLGFFLTPGLIIAVGIAIFLSYKRHQKDMVELAAFALANGLSYVGRATQVELLMTSSLAFQGLSYWFSDALSGSWQFAPFAYANYSFEVGSGKNRTTYSYGVIALTLPVAMPQVFLASKHGVYAAGYALPHYAGTQALQLEGDFSKYFSAFAPEGQEVAALAMLAPDLMAQLIDLATNYDIEISGQHMFLYRATPLALVSELPALWAQMAQLRADVLDNLPEAAAQQAPVATLAALQAAPTRLATSVNWPRFIASAVVSVGVLIYMYFQSPGFLWFAVPAIGVSLYQIARPRR